MTCFDRDWKVILNRGPYLAVLLDVMNVYKFKKGYDRIL